MPSLELKFFVHHGNFIVQHVAGTQELVGSDVNLAHRLMKNHIFEHTGWKAYAMLTKVAMDCMMLDLEDVHNQIETYEHLGDIQTITINLSSRYDAIIASQSFYISEKDADVSVAHEFNLSQAEIWQMVTSPESLNALARYTVTWSAAKRPNGRTGVGAVNHCAHGKGVSQSTIIDWHPFDYYSAHAVDGTLKWYEMREIKPTPDKNRIIYIGRWKADTGLPRWITKLVGKLLIRKIMNDFISQIENHLAETNSIEETTA